VTKLIESTTTETLPSGTTVTTLHLTPEARHGLSTGGAAIVPREPTELTVHDHRMRQGKAAIALHLGTVVAVVLAASPCRLVLRNGHPAEPAAWQWTPRNRSPRRDVFRAGP
jgi:hypothetical protein